ncbi:metallopeptidase MepB [Cadophora sp. MPI-SDFR-AT-0126]|nr:metallopeptidase MepB [Leotiomycetes sp. MPI-SDFR-AT-0126]
MESKFPREAPQAPRTILQTPMEILKRTEMLIKHWREAQDQLVRKFHAGDATFTHTIICLAHIDNSIRLHAPTLTLYEVTSTHLDIGRASTDARKLLDDFRSERTKNQELYNLVHIIRERREDIDPESQQMIERMHQSFTRNGLNIPDGPDRLRFQAIKKRINHLTIEFQRNRMADAEDIWFTLNELDGAPEEILSRLENSDGKNNGKVRICLNEPDHCDIFVYVRSGEARKKFEVARSNEHVQNVPLLKEAVILCNEAAKLLGYASHATLQLESRMAKTPETVIAFLEELRSRLVTSGKKELDMLKELKKTDLESRGESSDGHFYPWDYAFYNRQLTKKLQSIDRKTVAEYFELQTTIEGMLSHLEALFGLFFEEIPNENIVWDTEVRVYSVWDEEELGGGFLGYLYLDLFARVGKDAGDFNYTLEPGFTREDGTRHYPSTVLFCSFAKPNPTRPSLLTQHNLVMLFHELGHGIHNLVSKATYSRFHGTNTALDFGEAPSQMLENWCWTPSFLKSLGRHYASISPQYLEIWNKTSTGKPQPPVEIPNKMIEEIIGSKYCEKPNFLLGQILLAMFDMKIHHSESRKNLENMDLVKEYNELIKEYQMFDISDKSNEWSSFFASIGHLMTEYDAGYYSYLLQVYSTDMFYTRFKGNVLNKKEGRRYRRLVLEKGGSGDHKRSLRGYLGRDPSTDAFYIDLGLY